MYVFMQTNDGSLLAKPPRIQMLETNMFYRTKNNDSFDFSVMYLLPFLSFLGRPWYCLGFQSVP